MDLRYTTKADHTCSVGAMGDMNITHWRITVPYVRNTTRDRQGNDNSISYDEGQAYLIDGRFDASMSVVWVYQVNLFHYSLRGSAER